MNKTESFINKCKLIYKNEYDLSKINYINSETPVEIICPIDGSFWPTPDNIIHKHSKCPKCSTRKRTKTKEQFVKESNEIHNNFYDYSKSIYINNQTKLIINCPIHGNFKMTPSHHTNYKRGCKECYKIANNLDYNYTVGRFRKNTEEFIKNAIDFHGNVYDYSLVKYIKLEIPVKIICKTHGEFQLEPYLHLNGTGCEYCHINKLLLDTETFLYKSNEIHNFKYDYSKSLYTGTKNNIIVICPIHGEFNVNSGSHMYGTECNRCVKERSRLTKDEFLKKCNEIHGSRYNYNLVDYVNTRTGVIIICEDHGNFTMTPHQHIYQSQNCPTCSNNVRMTLLRKFKFTSTSNINSILYCVLVYNKYEKFIKFGVTTIGVDLRLKKFKNFYNIEILYTFADDIKIISSIENEILTSKIFKKFQHTPMIKVAGYTECCSLEILKNIKLKEYCEHYSLTYKQNNNSQI